MSSTENISVHVRVRPLNDFEKEKGKAWRVEGNGIYQTDTSSEQKFSENTYKLDHVFDGNYTTAEVYHKTTQHLICQVVEGFNSTVFAYGQTSSGKTHTMRGTATEPGIIPLAVAEIFSLIEQTRDREFLIRVSYMELYNEDINDLLAPENQKLHVHEHKEQGVYVAGLREDIVATPDQVMELLEAGERYRHFGETKMNKQSSRSHTVFRMVVESRSREANPEDSSDFGAIRVSTLTLVDLAGSERIAKTGAEGVRMKEGASINKSLLTLGTVINKLSEGVAVQGGHIPYRDSKLTRILQPSLGGNAKTAIICAITPAIIHVDETHSTLRFACRAKRVVNNATVNEVLSDAAVLKRQAKEIEELRKMLTGTGNEHIEEEINRLRAELLRKDQENERMSIQLAAEKEERERAQRKVDNMTRMMLDSSRNSMDGKSRKDSRRETWCPGAAHRKRPLLSSIDSLLEEDPDDDLASRISEGGLVLRRSEDGTLISATPPHKIHRTGADDDNDVGSFELDPALLPPRPSSVIEGDLGTLQARVKELETQNALMQRELDHMSDMAQRQEQQLKDTEDELMTVAEEKDRIAPQLEEAKWRARQLEKELIDIADDRHKMTQDISAINAEAAKKEQQHVSVLTEFQSKITAGAAENAELKLQMKELIQDLEESKQLFIQTQNEKERLEIKMQKLIQDVADAEKKGKQRATEADDAKMKLDASTEMLQEAESRVRELYEENKRLTEHISDLESRKRAPLYQKKQEEELKAAVDKAQECEIRAAEAELNYKEAKAALEATEKNLAELQEEQERLQTNAADALADAAAAHEASLQKHLLKFEKFQAERAEELSTLQSHISKLEAENENLETTLREQLASLTNAHDKVQALQGTVAEQQSQIEETQQCKDAAAEHVKFLEEKAEQEAAAHEAALSDIQNQLSAAREELVQSHKAMQAALKAGEEEAELALQKAKAHLQAMQDKAETDMKSIHEAHAQELVEAKSQYDALVHVKRGLEQQKTEMEAKLVQAAGALHAAEELKELRRKYKEDTTKLSQQLKSASMGSKGTEKEAEKLKKEIDKLRHKGSETEAKLRTAIQDKNNFQIEKAAVERELKIMRSQAEKLTKNMDKISGQEEKKRESIMVGFNKTKSDLQLAQEGLQRAQVDLEKTQFELQVKKCECDALDSQLKESAHGFSLLEAERDNLAGVLADTEAELQSANDSIKHLRDEADINAKELSDLAERKVKLEEELHELGDVHAWTKHCKDEIEADLAKTSQILAEAEGRLAAAEARLPEIDELKKQLTDAQRDLTESGFKAQDERASFKVREAQLLDEARIMTLKLNQQAAAILEVQEALNKVTKEKESLQKSMEDKILYISSLEGQIDDAMTESMELQAKLESVSSQCQIFKQQSSKLESDLRHTVEEQNAIRSELATNASELEKHRAQAAAASCEVEQLMVEKSALEQQLQNFAELKISAEEQKTELASQLDLLQSTFNVLQCDKATYEMEMGSRLQEAVDSAEKWKHYAERMQTDQEEVQRSISDLQHNLQAAQSELAKAQDACNNLDLRASHAEATCNSLKSEFSCERQQLQATVSELQAKVETYMAMAEEAKTAAKAEREEALRLAENIRQLECHLNCTSVRLQQESSNSNQAKEQQLAAQLERLNAVERELTQAQQHAQQAEKEKIDLENAMASEIMKLQAALQASAASHDGEQRTEQLAAERKAALAAAEQNSSEVEKLRAQLAHLQRAMQDENTMRVGAGIRAGIADISDAQIMEVKEQAERQVAQLHSRIQQLQSQNNRLTEEVASLQQIALKGAASGAHLTPTERHEENAVIEARCSTLEAELRKSKRREEKLQALQYRLREDIQHCGGDLSKFDQLKDMRGLEYELDRIANRAARDKQVLKERLQEALMEIQELRSERIADAKIHLTRKNTTPLGEHKEN